MKVQSFHQTHFRQPSMTLPISLSSSVPGAPSIDLKPMELPIEFKPRDIDILCGRGRGVWDHIGNRQFKELIEANAHKYMTAKNKMDKGVVVASLVDSIREKGILFVKMDTQNQRWYDIGEYEARNKTSHAIRDHITKNSPIKRKGHQSNKNTTTRKPKQRQIITEQQSQQLTISCDYVVKQEQQPHAGQIKECKHRTNRKRYGSKKMQKPDIFQRLGLNYLSIIGQGIFESYAEEGATSDEKRDSEITTADGFPYDRIPTISDENEAVRWSELFPVESLNQFQW